MRSIILAVSVVLFASNAIAATPKKALDKPWPQEPTSFMGLKFSSNVTNDIPKCLRKYADEEKSLCYVDPSLNGYFSIQGMPSIGLSYMYQLGAKVTGGEIEYLYLTANVNDFATLKQVFISKYGNPSLTSAGKVKN